MSSPAKNGFAAFLRGLWNFLTTVVTGVLVTVESTVGWVLSAVSFIAMLIFVVPVIGTLLRWVWFIAQTAVWRLVGLVDFLVAFTGLWPAKILRIRVIILADDSAGATATRAALVPHIQSAIDIFHDEANVRLVPSLAFRYTTGFADKATAGEHWAKDAYRKSPTTDLLVECSAGALGDDLVLTGSRFTLIGLIDDFYGNFRKFIGYGAPLCVMIVRDVGDHSTIGCSVGPLTNYVTVEGSNASCMAHEIGHACGLWHIDDSQNLMYPYDGPTGLANWQVAMLRNSRHVTYF